MRWSDYRVLTFDTYGTLIDWERGILPWLRRMADGAGVTWSDDALLAAFGEFEIAAQRATPAMRYSELLGQVYERLAERLGAEAGAAEASAFGASVGDWPVFDDTPAALKALSEHFLLATLTNCDRASFRGSHARLGVELDLVVTAEDVGSYKPSARNFEVLLRRLRQRFGLLPRDLVHVAQSLTHDHVPATKLGLANVWINRRGGKSGGATVDPDEPYRIDHEFESLAAFAQAVLSGMPASRAERQ